MLSRRDTVKEKGDFSMAKRNRRKRIIIAAVLTGIVLIALVPVLYDAFYELPPGTGGFAPVVYLTDKCCYHMDPPRETILHLRGNYQLIGSIQYKKGGGAPEHDWSSPACSVGDLVYQDPYDSDEVYVYTTLFNGETYHYLRFEKSEVHEYEMSEGE